MNVIAGGGGTVVSQQNDSTSTTIDPSTVEAALASANLTLNANTNITVSSGIIWASANTLTLSTNSSGSTVILNAPISGLKGGLTINTAGANDQITTGVNGTVDVAGFILQHGRWNQNSAILPAFSASNDFELQNNSTFLRVTGGDGSSGNPYQITDVYGLQGIGSPSYSLLTNSFVQENSIAANGTATWNTSAGFSAIGTGSHAFYGNYNGGGYTIFGLTINRPSQSYEGLFGEIVNGAIANVGLTGESVAGNQLVGGLTGYNYQGTVENTYAIGTVSGTYLVGGLVGENYAGTVASCYAAVTVNDSGQSAGGLVSSNASGGTIENSYATGAVRGTLGVGGLLGNNFGTVETSYASGTVVATSQQAGGLVGYNAATIETSYATGAVSGFAYDGGAGGL